ncbi:MAG: GTPase Era [Chromatiales bacterium]|nr:GTPase Era [Chromatiales bacterium]
MATDQTTRSAYVALVGRPNVGKSTLLNAMVGTKVSIATRRPQTTRHLIHGVVEHGGAQLVFVDTPGLHVQEPRAINRVLNRAAAGAMQDVDAIVWLIEALRWTEEDRAVAERLSGQTAPVIVAVNKVDRVADKTKLLPYLGDRAAEFSAADWIPLAARDGTNVDRLLDLLAARAQPGPLLFPDGEVTDRPVRFQIAEILREKLITQLDREIPYALTVELERYDDNGRTAHIDAVIWVERESQKAIVIGHQGAVQKRAGTRARAELERLLDRKVVLRTWVRVREGWSDDERALAQFGYSE